MTMDYGYREPSEPPRRRHIGLSARASVALVLSGFVVCLAIIRLAVHDPVIELNPASGTTPTSTTRHR